MLKLLVMLVTFLLVALTLLGLRQHRLELTSESAGIYDRIRERNETLLDQRVVITKITNPWALAAALNDSGVDTGEALRSRQTRIGEPAAEPGGVRPVETDLLAPVVGDGHANPTRPRQ